MRRPAPIARGLRPLDDRHVLPALTALVLLPALAFAICPLASIFRMSLVTADGRFTLANYVRFFSEARLVGIVYNSLLMSAATTVLTVVLAYGFAYAMARTAIPGRRLWYLIAMAPLFAPSLVHALGFQFLLGRSGPVNMAFDLGIDVYGFTGLVLANALYAFPHAVLILRSALSYGDQRMYESAVMLGASPWRIFWTVTLPGTRYGLMSAVFVVFTTTITDFGNAIVIGGNFKVLATEIYTQVIGQANFNLAAVLGVVLTTSAAYVVQKLRSPVARALYFLSVLPAAVPGMVLGLGYVLVFNDPANPLGALYGSLTLMAVNTAYHYHAQGFLAATTALKQISTTFDEASAVLGAGLLRTVRRVTLPMVWPALVRLGAFFFMRAMVTLSAVIFLFWPGNEVASVTVMQLADGGKTAQAPAFSTLIMLTVIAVLLLFQARLRLLRVRDVSLIG